MTQDILDITLIHLILNGVSYNYDSKIFIISNIQELLSFDVLSTKLIVVLH